MCDEVVVQCQDEDCMYLWTITEEEIEHCKGVIECINCGSTDVERN